MSDSEHHDDRLGSMDEARLGSLVGRSLDRSDDLAGLDAVEVRFARLVRLVRDAVRADARDQEICSSVNATRRAVELAARLPQAARPEVAGSIAAWWSRMRTILAECVYEEKGRLAGAGLRGAGTRQASYSVAEGAAACEIDLEVSDADATGRCRLHGQVHPADGSLDPSGAGVVAVPSPPDESGESAASGVEPVASGVVDREGFFDLMLPPGRYDLAFAIGLGPAALVSDLEVP